MNKGAGEGGGSKQGNLERKYFLNVPKSFLAYFLAHLNISS